MVETAEKFLGMRGSAISSRLVSLDVPFIDGSQNSYDRDRAVWDGRIQCRPAAIAYPVTSAQVSQLVLLAQSENLPLTVRGAGHSPLGSCICDDALVVD